MKAMVLIACAATATTLLSQPACSEDFSFAPVARQERWLLKSSGQGDSGEAHGCRCVQVPMVVHWWTGLSLERNYDR